MPLKINRISGDPLMADSPALDDNSYFDGNVVDGYKRNISGQRVYSTYELPELYSSVANEPGFGMDIVVDKYGEVYVKNFVLNPETHKKRKEPIEIPEIKRTRVALQRFSDETYSERQKKPANEEKKLRDMRPYLRAISRNRCTGTVL